MLLGNTENQRVPLALAFALAETMEVTYLACCQRTNANLTNNKLGSAYKTLINRYEELLHTCEHADLSGHTCEHVGADLVYVAFYFKCCMKHNC